MDERERLKHIIQKHVVYVGIPVHMHGFKYLCDAIIMILENWDQIYSVTNEIYPDIAKKHGVSIESVEKCIRMAIKKAWTDENTNIISVVTEHRKSDIYKRPTNSEFIGMIAWNVSLEREGFI